ncbi:MAG: (2Fe-2S) ferredoxin domain-containing protein, partial [Acholeplasmataceae bacterium]
MLRTQIVICGGTGCLSSKSQIINDEFHKLLKELHLEDEVYVYMSGCFGLCEKGPVVIIYPDQVFYVHITKEDVEEIVKEHIVKGNIVSKLEYKEKDETNKYVRKTFEEM